MARPPIPFEDPYLIFLKMKKYLKKLNFKYCNLADIDGMDCMKCNHLDFCKDFDEQFYELIAIHNKLI